MKEEKGWASNWKFWKERRINSLRKAGSSVIDYIIGNNRETDGRKKQNEVGSYTIESSVDRTADDKEK